MTSSKNDLNRLSLETLAIASDSHFHERHLESRELDSGLSPSINTATTYDLHQTDNYIYSRHSQPTRNRLEYLLSQLHGLDGKGAVVFPSGVSAIRSVIEYYKPKRVFANRGYKGSLDSFKDLTKLEIIPTLYKPRKTNNNNNNNKNNSNDKDTNATTTTTTTTTKTDDSKTEKMEEKSAIAKDTISQYFVSNNESIGLNSNDLILIECPTNPFIEIFDLYQIVESLKKYNCKIAVDCTTAPSVVLQPFKYGVDILVYSLTKYIGGHSDICAGCVVFNTNKNKLLVNDCYKMISQRTHHGCILGNLETWLLMRSIRTVFVRMRQQSYNACKVAFYLKNNEKSQKYIESVHHTSLESHYNYKLALKMFEKIDNSDSTAKYKLDANGNLLSEEKNEKSGGDDNKVYHPALMSFICQTHEIGTYLLKSLKLIRNATSFGGIETTIDRRVQFDSDIDSRLMRLSVGLESWYDVVMDFDQAFDNIQQLLSKKSENVEKQSQSKGAAKGGDTNEYGGKMGTITKLFTRKNKNKPQ